MNKVIVTNPENESIIKEALESASNLPFINNNTPLYQLEYQLNPSMPPRKITHTWEPPPATTFMEYGVEDEGWMRPLKLGTLHEVDEGPLFYIYDTSYFQTVFDLKSKSRLNYLPAPSKLPNFISLGPL